MIASRSSAAWSLASNSDVLITVSPPVPLSTLRRNTSERDPLVGARFARQSEHALADGVALDLVRASADAVGQVGEKVEAPPPAVGPAGTRQGSRRPDEVEGQFARADDVLAAGQ